MPAAGRAQLEAALLPACCAAAKQDLGVDALTVALLLSGVRSGKIAAYLAARVLPSLLPQLLVDEVGNLAALAALSVDCLHAVTRSLRQARLERSRPISPRPPLAQTSPRSRP